MKKTDNRTKSQLTTHKYLVGGFNKFYSDYAHGHDYFVFTYFACEEKGIQDCIEHVAKHRDIIANEHDVRNTWCKNEVEIKVFTSKDIIEKTYDYIEAL